jgi:hypothetical protein
MTEVTKIVNTKYGDVEIENIAWHRGVFPLPSGRMRIDDKIVTKIAKRYGLDGRWKLVEEFLNYCGIYIYSVEFSSSYIEFLFPKSGDYGFNLNVEWLNDKIEDSDLEDFVEDESEENREFLMQKKEDIERFLDNLNDIYYLMTDSIYTYINDLKEEVEAEEVYEYEDE